MRGEEPKPADAAGAKARDEAAKALAAALATSEELVALREAADAALAKREFSRAKRALEKLEAGGVDDDATARLALAKVCPRQWRACEGMTV